MKIKLSQLKPTYMAQNELEGSMVYNKEEVVLLQSEKVLIRANSGKGKSSLLNFIYGINKNYKGKIIVGEGNSSQEKIKKNELSYVFQDMKLFDELTVFENIEIKNQLTNHKTKEEILDLISQMKLAHKTDNLVGKLSLGQQQRVAIIRSLCQPFNFLLMDEPFSHLDEENIAIIVSVVNKELESQKAGLLITSLSDNSYFDYDKTLII